MAAAPGAPATHPPSASRPSRPALARALPHPTRHLRRQPGTARRRRTPPDLDLSTCSVPSARAEQILELLKRNDLHYETGAVLAFPPHPKWRPENRGKM